MIDSLKDHHFKDLCRLMEAHTGIQLPPTKRMMLEGRLRKRVRSLGVDSLQTYGAMLFDEGGLQDEFPHLVDNVTTNKTDFFREPDHFDALRLHMIPRLLNGRDRDTKIKLWSAACSMGAEAFTMAMVLAEMQTTMAAFPFAILGTDISHVILTQARAAIYSSAMLDMIPEPYLSRYVMHASDPGRQQFRIAARLRHLVRFEHLNLMDRDYPFDSDIDVVFCRNILIYFSKAVQQEVLTRLASHLRPGGYLVLGHSESFAMEGKTEMVQISPTVFQKAVTRAVRERAA